MTGWHKLVFGSVAEKVVKLATCPVLVLRAQCKVDEQDFAKAAPSAVAR
jgi:Universal stress protein family